MTEPVEIPNRAAFKASEVCEIAQIPPYVLKSWEKEFPGLGVSAKPGGARVYRRSDVEQVLRIKQLLFAEGLTLAGARRKLEGEPPAEEEPLLPEFGAPVAEEVREKVAKLKQEMRSLLDFLEKPEPPAPPAAPAPSPTRPWGQVTPSAAETSSGANDGEETAPATSQEMPAEPPKAARRARSSPKAKSASPK